MSAILDAVLKLWPVASAIWDRVTSKQPKPPEPDAIPGDVRQEVSASEAARRASHGPFKKTTTTKGGSK
jgi:hypothetical protein